MPNLRKPALHRDPLIFYYLYKNTNIYLFDDLFLILFNEYNKSRIWFVVNMTFSFHVTFQYLPFSLPLIPHFSRAKKMGLYRTLLGFLGWDSFGINLSQKNPIPLFPMGWDPNPTAGIGMGKCLISESLIRPLLYVCFNQ